MKKISLITPVTQENFPQAWEWVDAKRRKNTVRKFVRKIAGAVGNLVFFLLMCVVQYSVLMWLELPGVTQILEKCPLLPQVWAWLLQFMHARQLGPWEGLGILLAAVYGISLAAALLTSGLVRLCCRPKAKPVPEGDVMETSRLLQEEAERLAVYAKNSYTSTNTWYNILFAMIPAVLFSVVGVQAGITGDETAQMLIANVLYSPFFIPGLLGIWMGYAILAYVVILFSRLLCFLRLPEGYLEQIRQYALECDPEKKAQIEEEDRILALAEQIKLRRKQMREAILRTKR